MKSMKFLAIILVICLFAGCGSSTEGSKDTESSVSSEAVSVEESENVEEKKDGETIKIGVALANIGDVFDRALYEGMMSVEEKYGDKIELLVLDAKGDVSTQIANMEQLINSKMDVIVLWPNEKDALSVGVQTANDANIPVICVNTFTSGGEFIYVGSDDVDAGRIQGEWMAENFPENATYCYIMGPIGHSGQIGRKQGLEEVLAEKRPDIKLLAEQTGLWDRAKGLSLAEDYLKSYPEVTAFASQNDNMALGIVEALRTVDKIGEVMVLGTDGSEEACVKIKEGEMSMSVFQNARLQGSESIEVALGVAEGTWSGEDLIIPFEAIDASNVDQYLEMYAEYK